MSSFLDQLFKGGAASKPKSRKPVSRKTMQCRQEGFKVCVGSKHQVWNGTAKETAGGVKRSGLMQKPNSRIVFKSKSIAAKKANNLGLGTKIEVRKGTFGAFSKATGKQISGLKKSKK